MFSVIIKSKLIIFVSYYFTSNNRVKLKMKTNFGIRFFKNNLPIGNNSLCKSLKNPKKNNTTINMLVRFKKKSQLQYFNNLCELKVCHGKGQIFENVIERSSLSLLWHS